MFFGFKCFPNSFNIARDISGPVPVTPKFTVLIFFLDVSSIRFLCLIISRGVSEASESPSPSRADPLGAPLVQTQQGRASRGTCSQSTPAARRRPRPPGEEHLVVGRKASRARREKAKARALSGSAPAGVQTVLGCCSQG